ncbi:MAG: hypothetical protein ACOVT5_03220 [Armatimonadaceae bacterium]
MIGILVILLGLLLPAVASVRETARVMHTCNNLRQIALGVQQLSADRDDQVRNLPKNSPQLKPLYREQTVFWMLLPYVHGPHIEPGSGATKQQILDYYNPQVKIYSDPRDPSLDDEYVQSMKGQFRKTSYVANVMAFDGFVSLASSVPDGLSNTLAFTTHYYHCGTDRVTEKFGDIDWGNVIPSPTEGEGGGDRRATFADAGCRDVVPVRDPVTGKTVPSRPGATFEVRPKVADADARLPQAFSPRGLQVAFFDGSVRTVRPSVDPSAFWSAVTPNGSEVAVPFD